MDRGLLEAITNPTVILKIKETIMKILVDM
jgi:hypothetical protein